MSTIRSLLTLVLATACVAVATPAHAQRIADLAPGAVSHVQPAPSQNEIPLALPLLSANRGLAPALRPATIKVSDAAAARRLSVGGHAAVGAAAGAATGALASLAVYALVRDCNSGQTMCGLAFPFMIGGGAVTGGVVGLVVGLVRNR